VKRSLFQLGLHCNCQRSSVPESPVISSQKHRADARPCLSIRSSVALLRAILSVIAFHEKAGRSQRGSFLFSWDKVFSPAECHYRHPSIRPLDERSFRSVQAWYSRLPQICGSAAPRVLWPCPHNSNSERSLEPLYVQFYTDNLVRTKRSTRNTVLQN
jgi:hypothetical protein